jgi:ferredoxin
MSRLQVDWTRCDGHGLCARLLAERVGIDEWGFPVIDSTPLTPQEADDAKLAVQACPSLALTLRSDEQGRALRAGLPGQTARPDRPARSIR